MKLSIIVPVINEATTLPDLLAQLLPLQQDGCEVLLVDGGSSDNSTGLAERAGLQLIRSQRGRALQMNAGVAQATGEVLLFLHADTRLPEGAPDLVTRALSDKAHCWGRFDVRIAGRHAMLRVIGTMMNLRSRWSGIATGDQAMFVSRELYQMAGGFPDIELMEDIRFSAQLKQFRKPLCCRAKVLASSRRWESRGILRTVLTMFHLRLRYALGASPASLARDYD